MTIPESFNFPAPSDFAGANPKEAWERLLYSLNEMYQTIETPINGVISGSETGSADNWTPTLNGSTAGTFTYGADQRIGWIVRQGIFTEVFFDITWTATTASNNLYLELPYIVTTSRRMPFVGTVQASGITFGSNLEYLVINAIPGTRRGEIWGCGSGQSTANQAVVSSGRLIGSLRYIGTSDA